MMPLRHLHQKIRVFNITGLDLSIALYNKCTGLIQSNNNCYVWYWECPLYQGQYLKSRQYFENIVKVDPDSWIGYAGLL